MKLFTKYNRINLAVMTFLFLLAGVIYYIVITKVLVYELDEALLEYKTQVGEYVAKNDSLPVFKNFEEVQVTYRRADRKKKHKISQEELFNISDQKTETFRQIVFTQYVGNQLYEIRVAKPLEGTKVLIRTIAYSTLAILLLIIVLSVLLNYLLLRKLWKPFYAAIKEMETFRLGNHTSLVLPQSDIDEFSLMNKSLSKAINSAKDDYRMLKEFTENASHETQTPLAIIRSKLDLVIQDEGLSGAQTDALKSAYAAVSRLSKLNQSLLLLAKIENHQFTLLETIGLKERVEDKITQFNEFWEGRNITVNSRLEPADIKASPELIDLLLNNLLSNAARHNVVGGEINILLSPGKLEISNTAASAALDTMKLFSRFYKEAQHSTHNGLGLSIVKQIGDNAAIDITYEFRHRQHYFILQWGNLIY